MGDWVLVSDLVIFSDYCYLLITLVTCKRLSWGSRKGPTYQRGFVSLNGHFQKRKQLYDRKLTEGTWAATKIIPTDTSLNVFVRIRWNLVVLCRRRAWSWWSENKTHHKGYKHYIQLPSVKENKVLTTIENLHVTSKGHIGQPKQ